MAEPILPLQAKVGRIRVIPRAATTTLDGIYDDAIKVRLQSPPVDGKANSCLIQFFAKLLGTSKSDVQLIRGAKNRNKALSIDAALEPRLRDALAAVK